VILGESMSQIQADFTIGSQIDHKEFGTGVVTAIRGQDYAEVFFQTAGAKTVPISSIRPKISPYLQALDGIESDTTRIREFFLACELAELPLLDNAASLTAAKVDLLPHQIVLVHRIASGTPRRFLIADEVGLGKTIETALLLRELASRGEMTRAMMIVPAGLVENWRRELNDVFNLNFEVFGSEGDVTDRKTNAFMKHNRLIASIDTLKRPKRLQRLLEAPSWDLIVFDEAHHLTAFEKGKNKVHKTENYALAEALREHSRDLLLLSATPHQGDHFRFWRLAHLLDPTLFESVNDMLANRHRLNSIVIRRTKADACDTDGQTLFARRQVVTKSFELSHSEHQFYEKLNNYLQAGFDLASRSTGKARAIGFVMSIFQKIAASSFAAVKRTLENRAIALAILEAVLAEDDRDVTRRDNAVREAREMIRTRDGLSDSSLHNALIDKYISDIRLKHLKKRELAEAEDFDDERSLAQVEGDIAALATVAIPGEREMILDLLRYYPTSMETKVQEMNRLLATLWRENANEKVVIFATFLGTVEMLKRSIETVFDDKRVEVYKGGDHGAKTAAEKRFRDKDGPQVMLCTAAGREGINLQYSRILINFDLPWNPMDVEQRIGRIHRYGQANTSQVYNFVSSDTIEGKIYQKLEAKIAEIAKTLGKVDKEGQVAEDIRSQILGQLSTAISYDQLYRDALSDPALKRTELELEVALTNAKQAREVVFELFQDLDRFDLSEFKGITENSGELAPRLLKAYQAGVSMHGGGCAKKTEDLLLVAYPPLGFKERQATINRDLATSDQKITLIGFDDPIVSDIMKRLDSREWSKKGVAVRSPDEPFLLVALVLSLFGERNTLTKKFTRLAVSKDGLRLPDKEHLDHLESFAPVDISNIDLAPWRAICHRVPEILERDLKYRGLLSGGAAFQVDFVGMMLGVI
jgi:superfamily II DNA or RNA helicase